MMTPPVCGKHEEGAGQIQDNVGRVRVQAALLLHQVLRMRHHCGAHPFCQFTQLQVLHLAQAVNHPLSKLVHLILPPILLPLRIKGR